MARSPSRHDEDRTSREPPSDAGRAHPERWRRVDEIVQRAFDLESAERDAFVRDACGDDRSLLDEVLSLLQADGRAGDFLDGPCSLREGEDLRSMLGLEDSGPSIPRPDELGEGGRLGSYRLLRAIGHGGMGVVYLGERADEAFEQRVAVKVLRQDLDSAAVAARFRTERQILASLDHPNIARLLDGGTAGSGHPYLVMEHVEGVPIDRFCDGRRLGLRARLELFLDVCSAVRYAHQNLVVHRDLKPNNILVTEEGHAKLLDFGVAKLLEPSVVPLSVETTVTGNRPMTLSYASPEQLTGKPVTTASDVYSLGVLLYRLLTGRLPRRFSGLFPADLEEMMRAPQRPSVAVERGDPPAAEVAELRGLAQSQLPRRLRGDLDGIALQALEADPRRRYANVAELEEDIRRHLEGRPVQARAASWTYVTGKFLRRHWAAVAAGAAFLILLLAFTGLMVVQRDRLARERDRAEEARVTAQEEREKAEQIADLMVGIFDEVGPERAMGREVTVREVLDRRAKSLPEELGDRPLLLATLQAKMGDVYWRIGAYPEARRLLEEALRIRERELGPDDPLLAQTLSDLATAYGLAGQVPKAASLLERAVGILSRAESAGHEVLVPALGRLAIARSKQGNFQESEALTRRVLAIQEERFGPDSPQVAHALHNLAIHEGRKGEIESARSLFERALAIQETTLPEDDPNTLRSHFNLGAAYLETGLHERARSHLSRALEGQRRVLGSDHTEVGETLLALGDLARVTGELDRAETLYDRASETLRGALDPPHPLLATLAHSRGLLAAARGERAEAERLYRSALELEPERPRGPRPETVVRLADLAEVALVAGRHREAEQTLAEAASVADNLRPCSRAEEVRARVERVRSRLPGTQIASRADSR